MLEALTALITIAGVVLLGSASPGPNLVAVSAGAVSSRADGLWTAAGVASASATWAMLGVTGLALVVSNSPTLYEALRWAGAAYLLFLAAKVLLGLRRSTVTAYATKPSASSGVTAWSRGYLINMGNPKTAAFVASFFLSALPATGPTWLYIAAVGVAGGVSLGWYSLVALLLSRQGVRAVYGRLQFWIELAFGVALLAMGLLLLIG